ncbi:MAG: hypothetical protein SGILL_003351, partial [Bacillariaceae sp.]
MGDENDNTGPIDALTSAAPGALTDNNTNATSSIDATSNNNSVVPQHIQRELPFLVTHWLANYGSNSDDPTVGTNSARSQDERQEAMERLRLATSELASAFSTLGAYGTTFRVSSPYNFVFDLRYSLTMFEKKKKTRLIANLSLVSVPHKQPGFVSASFARPPQPHNSTYSDLNRQNPGLSPAHLEHLAQSTALHTLSANNAATDNARANLLLQAASPRDNNTPNGAENQSPKKAGRSIQDAIVLDEDLATDENINAVSAGTMPLSETASILHRPSLVLKGKDTHPSKQALGFSEPKVSHPPTMEIKTTHADVGHETAETVRKLLLIREKTQSTKVEIRSLESSFALHERRLSELKTQSARVNQSVSMSQTEKSSKEDALSTEKQGCDRVMSQLQRKLQDLRRTLHSSRSDVSFLEAKASGLQKQRRTLTQSFHDPYTAWKGALSKQSRVGGCSTLRMVLDRQYGLSRTPCTSLQDLSSSLLRTGINATHFLETQKNILKTRLSHAVTINTHMIYPVYCLRFDRTGRYFITGADDQLAKVFYLGADKSCRLRNGRHGNPLCNVGANSRGAILVCSLRGHAGVINDIDVSSDNSFLATASTDGDVRIWGLTDGCPVAILRGHKNGANMVSWSTLTPYRLVTAGSDGFARVWDIREACLKRYGKFIGRRDEYKLSLSDEEQETRESRGSTHHETTVQLDSNFLPPLPQRGENAASHGSDVVESVQPAPIPPPVPPLPAPENETQNSNGEGAGHNMAVPPLPGARSQLEAGQNVNNEHEQVEAAPGDFVTNDLIDEGVKLVSKYQHGNSREVDQQGPGTRSRRAAVNVICVARCPLGNQFATGSDDGIVRVWQDFDDNAVAIVDRRLSNLIVRGNCPNPHPPSSGIQHKPLLKLTGHVSTITDLFYSNAGDRILSASQKDGVARIWNVAGAMTSADGDKRVTQIVIKLIDPSSKRPLQSIRRRPGNSTTTHSSKVSCDVAVWTHDDSMIVTSQCVLLKQNGSEVQPGSQYICVWLSRTGLCLMGISGAHKKACNVVIAHPLDSSLICTASADGFAKVWDLEQGKCIFTHQNKLEVGPVDESSTGGYLDGAFNPDGTTIVLTDDSGQVSIFDSIAKQDDLSNNGSSLFWIRDQYFSNDYYELFYDSGGYCIEKGSRKPPHLAPKSRGTHKGSSFSGADEITETFKKLLGPVPLNEDVCRWQREDVLTRGKTERTPYAGIASDGIRIAVRELDPLSTLIIKGVDHVDADETAAGKRPKRQTSSPSNSNRRNESARFSYLGYEDLLMREGLEDDIPESEDEEFEPAAARTSRDRRLDEDIDDSEDDDLDDMSFNSHEEGRTRRRRRTARSNNASQERQVRAQRRAHRRSNMSSDFMEIDSDDDMIAQFVSINKTPSGPYLRDFSREGHLWKLKSSSDARRVHREWLRRDESDLSYVGKKFYTPQCGDSVVYIPRAHYETIKEFPSLSPPWQDWPTGTAWPIVRCTVQNMRFRFPYEDYFRQSNRLCRSIVAIVTLQVTGIPEPSTAQEFPWPKPSFVEPSTSAVFEVSLFENSHVDFLIPDFLYSARLESLQKHIQERRMRFSRLPVDVFYADDDNRREDSEMEPWASSLGEVLSTEPHSDVHLNESGFGVLQVTGAENDSFVDTASPWDLNTEGLALSRPHLTDDESSSILDAINSLLQNPDISSHFQMPVDMERYYDYAAMIEVPMDLMFIKRRLNNNYYGSKLSVVADLRLMRDNCIKYNTRENEMSQIAIAMCEEFEQNVLSPDERSQLINEEDFDKIQEDQSAGRQSSNLRIRLSARTIRQARQAANFSSASTTSDGRYSLRDRSGSQRRSSLETLPVPSGSAGTPTRGSRRNHEAGAPSGGRETRGGRYSLRGQGTGNRTETLARLRASEPESRAQRAARRSRTMLHEGGRNNDQYSRVAVSRRNSRSRRDDPPDYHEVNSDEDDQYSGVAVSRRSSRSGRANPPVYQEANSDEDEDFESQPAQGAGEVRSSSRSGSSSRPTAASSRGSTVPRSGVEDDDVEASDDEEHIEEDSESETTSSGEENVSTEERSPTTRRETRGTSRPARSNGRSSDEPRHDSSSRRSTRRSAPQRGYTDVETSDVEEYAEEYAEDTSDNESEPEVEEYTGRRQPRRRGSLRSPASDSSEE